MHVRDYTRKTLMSQSTFHSCGGSLLVFTLLAWAAGDAAAQQPSLAEIARQESARRAAIPEGQRARIYTNADLRDSGGLTVAAEPAGPVAPADTGDRQATPTTGTDAAEAEGSRAESTRDGGELRDEAYWRGRMAEAEAARARAALMAAALQNRADGLWAQFTAVDDPARQRAIERQRNDTLEALENARVELEDAERTVAGIREEARRAGAPPGWLR